MVKLRLARGGRKKRPFYRIVAAHSEFKRDGRFLEKVGTYDPQARDGEQIILKDDRIIYWLQQGAQPTDTARNIFSSKGLMLKLDLLKRGMEEAEIDAAVEKFKEEKATALLEKAKKQLKAKEEKAKKAEKEAAAAAEAEQVEEAAEATETAEEAPAEESSEA